MIIQRIKLGPGQDPGEFVRFMRDEFIRAMQRDPTRLGQATYIELSQGNTESTLDEFILLVDGLTSFHPAFVGPQLQKKFESFGAQVDEIANDFRTVEVWQASPASGQ